MPWVCPRDNKNKSRASSEVRDFVFYESSENDIYYSAGNNYDLPGLFA